MAGVELTLVVDTDLARANRIAAAFGARATATDHRAAIGRVDAAVVAAPHDFHAPIAIDLLNSGVHVLVEKPMALHARDCDAMIAAATASGRVLAVGLQRRFHDSLRFVKNAVDTGLLGQLTRVEIREGGAFHWQVATDALFKSPAGGVLADIGVHVLDLLVWWFGDCRILSYQDDGMGGVEADCQIRVGLPDGVEAFVELSRTRELPGTALFEGTYGILEAGTRTQSTVLLALGDRRVVLEGKPTHAGGQPPESLVDLCRPELEDFLDAIREGRGPVVTGKEARKSVSLIEACYTMRKTIEYPWEEPLVSPSPVTAAEA
jgi:predicted dehydrogenase